MTDNSLLELMGRVKSAKANLKRIRTAYENNPNLLSFYEPSAKHLVESLESQLTELLYKETDCEFTPADKRADLWIRIDGEQFHNGKGPIGLVGNFLNKLNNASKHAVELIAKAKNVDVKSGFMDLSGSFDLATTATGSLKLGLKKPDIKISKEKQVDLFTYDTDPWEKFKDTVAQNEIVVESMNLLLSAIASAENEEIFDELTKKYNEKDVLKMIHFAKQVVPSAQSNIETVSFEIENLNVKQKKIETNKETRKLLSKQAKKLIPNKEYITGKGKVRGIDLDDKSLIIRPLEYDEYKHDEIRCYFMSTPEDHELDEFLDRYVELSGFIVFSSNNRLLRLEIEEIKFEKDTII